MTEGRNVLMAMFQGGGNIPLLLPIVARLVALGHQVRVLVGPGVRRSRLPVSESLWRSLHATGAEIIRLREPEVHPWDAAPSVPGLLLGWTPKAFRSVAQEARAQLWLPALNQTRTRVGLSPLRWYFAQHDRAARVVVLTSPHFDYPTQSMPPNVRLVGTPLDEEAPTPWDPPWSATERQPRLLVSLSTFPQGQAPLMERILTALGGLPVRAIVTLGPSLAASRFTPPPNVIFETFVPHGAVLLHVDALVTQCGLGTVMKSLAHGVPLVCIPLVGDQPDNAARVVAHEVGLRVPADATPARIREAIQRVVTDPSFRQAARQFATRMAGEDAVQAASTKSSR